MKNFKLCVLVLSLSCFLANYFLLAELQCVWSASQFTLFDFRGQWQLCAYTLRGFDPYPLRGVAEPLIEELGKINVAWSTTPWGLTLGNFFYPGFLSLSDAAAYFLALNLFALIITARQLVKRFKFAPVVLPAFLAYFFISTYFGNAGAVICCLLIICCLQADESPIFAGVLLSLAMIKPQVALPVCFALLLRKNFKVLITAAAIDCAAWAVAAVITGQTPLRLLTEFLSVKDTGGEMVFSGLFTLTFPENKLLAMGLSMLAGILFIRLTFKDEEYFWTCPACLATTFCAYSFHNEFFILILPALVIINSAARADSQGKIFWLASFVFLATAPCVLLFCAKFFVGDLKTAFWLARTIFAVMLILLGLFMAKNFLKIFFLASRKIKRRGE